MRRLIVLLLLAGAARADEFERELEVYRGYLKRKSLFMHHRGRLRLADTGDPRALQILSRSYARPRKPKDQVRYLLATIGIVNFGERKHLPQLKEWRHRHGEPIDAWLWFHTLRRQYQHGDAESVVSIARDEPEHFLRTAALEVLIERRDPGLAKWIAERAAAVSEEDPQALMLLSESLARALHTLKAPTWHEPALALIALLDREDLPDRSRLVIGRHLARLLRTPRVYLDGEPWRREVAALMLGRKRPVSDERYARRPVFAELETAGDRIAYVIDLSDSMLTPLSEEERGKLPRGPVTGNRRLANKATLTRDRNWKRALEAVSWDRVHNRFEAARELLKTSLLGLEKDQRFAVIGFGDRAVPLKSTPGLTAADPRAIVKIFRELDAIRPGPPRAHRPHGTLRGRTNLHGGLHRAFKLIEGKLVGAGEYVDPVTFEEGCDTIFLLSDGEPTWDDWAAFDTPDPEDRAGDMETGHRTPGAQKLEFPGVYHQHFYLLDDVARLNLFRKVAIHCVGIGEADMDLLGKIAALGLGETVRIGG